MVCAPVGHGSSVIRGIMAFAAKKTCAGGKSFRPQSYAVVPNDAAGFDHWKDYPTGRTAHPEICGKLWDVGGVSGVSSAPALTMAVASGI